MTTKKESEEAVPTFEKALERLEQIVKAMEEGRLTLDQMTGHFEEANKLARFCDKKLNEVERKIEILTKRGEDGQGVEEPFETRNASAPGNDLFDTPSQGA